MRDNVAVAIACLTILSASVLAGCTSPPPPPVFQPPLPQDLTLIPDNWDAGTLRIDITNTQNTAGLLAANLTYEILDGNGTLIYTRSSGSAQTVAGTTVTITFQDGSGNGFVSAGDTFRIQVVPSDSTVLSGGAFDVYAAGERIADVSVP